MTSTYREVTLTGYELVLGASVGCRRQIQALLRQSAKTHGSPGGLECWGLHVNGACGEQAAAKAMGRYWSGSVGTYGQGDDISGCQVRTRSDHKLDLVIRPNDPNEAVFVLVTGVAPLYRVHGWILAADGKQGQWLQNHGDRPHAWFVPKEALLPLETCPR